MSETGHELGMEIGTEEKSPPLEKEALEKLKKQIALERTYIVSSVKNVLSKYGPVNPSLVEDITQQILEKAIRLAPTYDSSRGKLRAWLSYMIKTGVIDNFRRQRDTEINTDADTEVDKVLERIILHDAPPDPILKNRIAAALENLTTDEKNFLISSLGGATYKKLSQEIGNKSIKTVGARLFKIKKKLKDLLEDEGIDVDEILSQ